MGQQLGNRVASAQIHISCYAAAVSSLNASHPPTGVLIHYQMMSNFGSTGVTHKLVCGELIAAQYKTHKEQCSALHPDARVWLESICAKINLHPSLIRRSTHS